MVSGRNFSCFILETAKIRPGLVFKQDGQCGAKARVRHMDSGDNKFESLLSYGTL